MSKGCTMIGLTVITPIGRPNIRRTRSNTRRSRFGTRNARGLQPAYDLLVLALVSLLESLIPGVRHGRLDPGPARQGMPDSPGRLPHPA